MTHPKKKKIAGSGNVEPAAICCSRSSKYAARETVKAHRSDMRMKVVLTKRMMLSQGNDASKSNTLKELPDTFHSIESTKDKVF